MKLIELLKRYIDSLLPNSKSSSQTHSEVVSDHAPAKLSQNELKQSQQDKTGTTPTLDKKMKVEVKADKEKEAAKERLLKQIFINSFIQQDVDKFIEQLNRQFPNQDNDFLIEEERRMANFCKSEVNKINQLAHQHAENMNAGYEIIDNQYSHEHHRVVNQLKHMFKRQISKNEKIQHTKQQHSNHRVQLETVRFNKGIHNNHLSHLPLDEHYCMYIDETGKNHEYNELDHSTDGKFVSLTIPKSKINRFEPSKNHAVDGDQKENDRLMSKILTSNVGIFGFQVKDTGENPVLSWIEGVTNTILWTALQMPVQEKRWTLEVFVEATQIYQPKTDTRMFKELIIDRLKTIEPSFENITLKIQFLDKKAPSLMPYVDVVAHAWGGGYLAQQRLKQSKLKGHCLIESGHSYHFDDIIKLCTVKGKLQPREWFDLVHGASQVSSFKWLANHITQLGKITQNNSDLWAQYLAFTQLQLRKKETPLAATSAALTFLKQSAPSQSSLSPELELELIRAELRVASHLGQINPELDAKTIDLTKGYMKENARLTSEIILGLFSMRMNSLSTHLTLKEAIETHIKAGVYATGLHNFGKLFSSLGQLYLTQKDFTNAIAYFEKAIEQFEQLSHKPTQLKEISQTTIYLLHTLLQTDDKEYTTRVFNQLLEASNSNREALGKRDFAPVYTHHVLLKAMILKPDWFQAESSRYLNNQNNWNRVYISDNAEHPWQWILVYRALLLESQGTANDKDMNFRLAQKICQNGNEDIFHYMKDIIITIQHHRPIQHQPNYTIGNQAVLSTPPESTPVPNSMKSWSEWLSNVLPAHYY
ncbi:hypothetical protein N9R79_06500 [Vibrio sp.]|nr:hypothetical protein [Vibrio sp.]